MLALSIQRLLQAGENGIAQQPEGVLRVRAEGGVDADQYCIRVATGSVYDDGVARGTTPLPANPVTRDEEITAAKLGRTDDVHAKPGKPSRAIDKGVILVKEATGNAIIGIIGNIHNGVVAAAYANVVNIDDTGGYCQANSGQSRNIRSHSQSTSAANRPRSIQPPIQQPIRPL